MMGNFSRVTQATHGRLAAKITMPFMAFGGGRVGM
jgi:hypothetical protein